MLDDVQLQCESSTWTIFLSLLVWCLNGSFICDSEMLDFLTGSRCIATPRYFYVVKLAESCHCIESCVGVFVPLMPGYSSMPCEVDKTMGYAADVERQLPLLLQCCWCCCVILCCNCINFLCHGVLMCKRHLFSRMNDVCIAFVALASSHPDASLFRSCPQQGTGGRNYPIVYVDS